MSLKFLDIEEECEQKRLEGYRNLISLMGDTSDDDINSLSDFVRKWIIRNKYDKNPIPEKYSDIIMDTFPLMEKMILADTVGLITKIIFEYLFLYEPFFNEEEYSLFWHKAHVSRIPSNAQCIREYISFADDYPLSQFMTDIVDYKLVAKFIHDVLYMILSFNTAKFFEDISKITEEKNRLEKMGFVIELKMELGKLAQQNNCDERFSL
jgi:hypothetical protein